VVLCLLERRPADERPGGERTAAALDVDLRVLPGAGHALAEEHPEEWHPDKELALRDGAAA